LPGKLFALCAQSRSATRPAHVDNGIGLSLCQACRSQRRPWGPRRSDCQRRRRGY